MRPVIQLVLAASAALGAALCWLHATSVVDVPPVADGQLGTVSVVYDPPLLLLAWLFATTAGVLAVLGLVAVARRRRRSALAEHTP